MLDNAVKDRSSPFRIPVFICGNQSDFDGRIVVLRKSDQSNNLVQYHSDIRSDKIEKLSIFLTDFNNIEDLLIYFEEFNSNLSKKTLNSYLKSVINP